MKLIDRIGRRLSLRDLNILLAVVDTRSMSKAAGLLAVSQPVVSKAIADMERTLGVPLLDRNPAGIEPTLYGRALIKRGTAVFDELRLGVKDMALLADPTAGEARVGGTRGLVAGIIPSVVGRLVRQYPRVLLEVIEDDFDGLQNHLRDRKIDLAIARAPGPVSDTEIASEVLFGDRLVVVAGSRSKWGRRRKVKFSDLIDEPWVFPLPGTVAASLAAEAFHTMGVEPPRARVTSSTMALNIHLLTAGHVLAFLPASTVRLSAKHLPLKALPIELQVKADPIVVTYLKNRTLNPVAKLFIECAHAVVKSSMDARQSAASRSPRNA
jgi:DNA-binding transcriptional LysR family regulator